MTTPNHGYTDDELADLTQAERDALALEGEDPSLTLDDIGDEAAADDAAAAADADAAPAADADAVVPASAAADADEDIPLLDDTPPENADTRLAEIASAKAELRKKYDDGEVSFEEYDSQKDELSREEREIERAVDKANIAAEMRQRAAAADWSKTVKGFLREHPEYQVPTDEASLATTAGRAAVLRYKALDQQVRDIAARNPNMDGKDILAAAHEELAQAFNLGKTEKQPERALTGRERAARDAVPTLANVPAAETSGTDSRWARLDNLRDNNPIAFEAELARLPESDRDAYLNA